MGKQRCSIISIGEKMAERDPKKRITSQIALAAIGLALGILLLSLSYVLPLTEAFIIVFVPFLSALLALKCDYRGQLLYLSGALAVSFIDMQEGFFSFLPNILIGLAFGDSVKKFSLSFASYLIALTISLLINALLIYPIRFFYQTDLIKIYAGIFNCSYDAFLSLYPLFCFLLCSVQTLICYIIIGNELPKIAEVPAENQSREEIFSFCASLLPFFLFTIGYFYLKWLAYLMEGYILLVGCWLSLRGFRKDKKAIIVIYVFIFLLGFLSLGLMLSFLPKSDYALVFIPLGFLLNTLGLVMVEYNKRTKAYEKPQEELKDLLK